MREKNQPGKTPKGASKNRRTAGSTEGKLRAERKKLPGTGSAAQPPLLAECRAGGLCWQRLFNSLYLSARTSCHGSEVTPSELGLGQNILSALEG